MTTKYAVITGASSGIGLAFANVIAERGYNVVMVSNEDEVLKQRASEVGAQYGVKAIPVTMDLSSREAPRALYDFCRGIGGGDNVEGRGESRGEGRGIEVEILVNNAGVYHDRDFLDDSAQFNSLILMLHVHTPAMLEYYFAKDMTARGRGYVINISSVTSDFGAQRMATYSSTKGFVRLFSRSTHVELHDKGVNVTCVRPGAVATTLYNLSPAAMRIGLAFGYIITPEQLARKAVRAVMHGRAQITPGLSTKLLDLMVGCLSTRMLRLIRRLRIF